MFWYLLEMLSLRRLGLSRPLRLAFFVVLLGCLFAGLIYAAVVFNAINERSSVFHDHAHSIH